jgi:amino acid transporter
MQNSKTLTTWSLIMINIIAIDSLRPLTFSAKFGPYLVFYYIIAILLFFIPSALVTTELVSRYPKRGGIFVWVEEAFGSSSAFFVSLIQWTYNVIWFPTIMIFIWSLITFLLPFPILQSKSVIFIGTLLLFWGCTYANIFGMKISSRVSIYGAILGTLVPMVVLIVIGIYSFAQDGSIMQDHHQPLFSSNSLPYFVELVFGLIGIEMSAMHADEVHNPAQSYPRAIFISGSIISLSLIASSLAICTFIKPDQVNLITGTLQAVDIFTQAHHLQWLTAVFGIMMILGSLATTSAWIIGPVKGLWAAAERGIIPHVLSHTNEHNAPVNLLIMQAAIYSMILVAFLYLPIETAFVLLNALTTQLSLIVYIVLFSTGIKLIKHRDDRVPYFKVKGLQYFCYAGIITSILIVGLGFVMPNDLSESNSSFYTTGLLMSFFITLPLMVWIAQRQQN